MKRLVQLAVLAAVVLPAAWACSPTPGARAVQPPPCRDRVIVYNHRGRCAAAAIWLLRAQDPAVRKGRYWHTYHGTSVDRYTHRAARATRLLKRRLGWRLRDLDGVFGPRVWRVVQGRQSLPLAYRVRKARRQVAYQKRLQAERRKRQRRASSWQRSLVAEARFLVAHGGWIYYTQNYPGREDIARRGLPTVHSWRGGDCSGAIDGLYIRSRHFFPAGGEGWTGTQSQRGTRVWTAGQSVSRLRVGDLVFYQSPGHSTDQGYEHVAMVIGGGGLVFSQGSDAGPYALGIYYRSGSYGPVEARRYRG